MHEINRFIQQFSNNLLIIYTLMNYDQTRRQKSLPCFTLQRPGITIINLFSLTAQSSCSQLSPLVTSLEATGED